MPSKDYLGLAHSFGPLRENYGSRAHLHSCRLAKVYSKRNQFSAKVHLSGHSLLFSPLLRLQIDYSYRHRHSW
jgi:hypothetical protein